MILKENPRNGRSAGANLLYWWVTWRCLTVTMDCNVIYPNIYLSWFHWYDKKKQNIAHLSYQHNMKYNLKYVKLKFNKYKEKAIEFNIIRVAFLFTYNTYYISYIYWVYPTNKI